MSGSECSNTISIVCKVCGYAFYIEYDEPFPDCPICGIENRNEELLRDIDVRR